MRIDDDDASSQALVPELVATGVIVLSGPRLEGWGSHHVFYDEMAAIARGAWIFVGNDDATFELAKHAEPWDLQLARVPTDGVIVQPACYQLGSSRYKHPGCCYTFPCVPNGAWRRLGHEHLQPPIDLWFDVTMRRQNNWRVHLLDGLTMNHQRDTEPVIAEHRRL